MNGFRFRLPLRGSPGFSPDSQLSAFARQQLVQHMMGLVECQHNILWDVWKSGHFGKLDDHISNVKSIPLELKTHASW